LSPALITTQPATKTVEMAEKAHPAEKALVFGKATDSQAVGFYRSPNEALHLLVSPNGFAEYFGAPRGEQLDGPDQLSEPVLPTKRICRW